MGRLTRQILPLIEREDPDIITAQEVFSTKATIPFPDTTFNLLQLVEDLGYEHVYFSPTWSMTATGEVVEFGNAIFSKYPLLQPETIFTNGHHQADIHADTYEPNHRNAQFVVVNTPAGQFHLVNHHAYWEPNPHGSYESKEKMQKVVDHLASLESLPIIVAGDMNVNPGTLAMNVFDGLLSDLTSTYQIRSTLSELGKVSDVACDHILVNSTVNVNKFAALDDLVSDHKALALEFEL